MFCVTGNSVYLDHKEEVLLARDRKTPSKIDRLLDELMEDGLLKRMKKRITDTITEEVKVWQSRPLDEISPYPVPGCHVCQYK